MASSTRPEYLSSQGKERRAVAAQVRLGFTPPYYDYANIPELLLEGRL
jgi:hypothetical protein